MKFIVLKEDLYKELKIFKKIKYPSYLKKIIKIYSDNGSLFLTTSNVDLTVKTKIDADIKDCENCLYFDLNLLSSIVKSLPKSSEICVVENKNKVKIENNSTNFSVLKLNDEQYSHLNQIFTYEFEKILTVKFGKLKDEVLKAVKFSCSDDDETVLTGVNFNLNDSLNISSTNRHFLLTSKINSKDIEKEIEFNLKSSALKVLFSLEGVSKFADVVISFSKAINVVKFLVDKYVFYFSKIQGEFPDFNDILSRALRENKNKVIVSKDAFLYAVRTSHQINDDFVTLDIKKNIIDVLSNDRISGESKTSISCKTNVKDYKKINMNPSYVETILDCIDDCYVYFSYDTELKPVLFSGENRDERFILMPMRS